MAVATVLFRVPDELRIESGKGALAGLQVPLPDRREDLRAEILPDQLLGLRVAPLEELDRGRATRVARRLVRETDLVPYDRDRDIQVVLALAQEPDAYAGENRDHPEHRDQLQQGEPRDVSR